MVNFNLFNSLPDTIMLPLMTFIFNNIQSQLKVFPSHTLTRIWPVRSFCINPFLRFLKYFRLDSNSSIFESISEKINAIFSCSSMLFGRIIFIFEFKLFFVYPSCFIFNNFFYFWFWFYQWCSNNNIIFINYNLRSLCSFTFNNRIFDNWFSKFHMIQSVLLTIFKTSSANFSLFSFENLSDDKLSYVAR